MHDILRGKHGANVNPTWRTTPGFVYEPNMSKLYLFKHKQACRSNVRRFIYDSVAE